MTNYKEIPSNFTLKGFQYKQQKRSGDVALYKQSKDGRDYYEVIIIQRHDGYVIAGNKFEPSEFYPRSEDWGINGFSYSTLKEAENKFQCLIKK
jgi:hypothetical protein